MKINDSDTTSQPEAHLPENYNDPETNGIIVPDNSPVYEKPRQKKPKIDGRFAPMKEIYFGLPDREFKVYAAMLLLGGFRGGVHLFTRPMLTKITGKKARALDNILPELARKGFIVREKSPRKKGALWRVNTEGRDIAISGDLLSLFPPNPKI